MKFFVRKIIFLICFLSVFSVQAFCSDDHTPEPINTDEIPQGLKDFRRFEIISLGAMPFVMMDVSLGFSTYKTIIGETGYTPTPFLSLSFKPSSEGLSSSEKWAEFVESDCFKVIISSVIISGTIGLSDYIINLVKRNSIRRRNTLSAEKNIIINSIADDPTAIKLQLPKNTADKDEQSIITNGEDE
jgi:hypothetical protein